MSARLAACTLAQRFPRQQAGWLVTATMHAAHALRTGTGASSEGQRSISLLLAADTMAEADDVACVCLPNSSECCD